MHKTFVIWVCVNRNYVTNLSIKKYKIISITLTATDNMDVNVTINTHNELGNDSTSKGFTLQLFYSKTTFQITFTCVIFTIAFLDALETLPQ